MGMVDAAGRLNFFVRHQWRVGDYRGAFHVNFFKRLFRRDPVTFTDDDNMLRLRASARTPCTTTPAVDYKAYEKPPAKRANLAKLRIIRGLKQ